ncbi:MAG: hypothetical protein AAGN66_16250 [Acidobacteriota bacterium]
MLDTLIAAEDTELYSVADARTRLGLPEDPRIDAILGWLVVEATAAIHGYLARVLARQRYLEVLESDGEITLHLGRFPVETEDLVVRRDGEVIEGGRILDARAGVLYLEGGFPSTAPHRYEGRFASYRFEEEPNPEIEVEYWAGYDLAEGPADGRYALPASYSRAAWLTVKAWWERDQRSLDLVKEEGQHVMLQYARGSEGLALPADAAALLDLEDPT